MLYYARLGWVRSGMRGFRKMLGGRELRRVEERERGKVCVRGREGVREDREKERREERDMEGRMVSEIRNKCQRGRQGQHEGGMQWPTVVTAVTLRCICSAIIRGCYIDGQRAIFPFFLDVPIDRKLD